MRFVSWALVLLVAGCASGGGGTPSTTGADAGPTRADAAPPIARDGGASIDARAPVDAPSSCASPCAPLSRCVDGECVEYAPCDGAGECPSLDEICRNRRCIPRTDDSDEDGSPAADDCDESRPDVRPGASEDCSRDDLDCDGSMDEAVSDAPLWFRDSDGDGAGAAAFSMRACTAIGGYVAAATDCDDTSAAIRPGAPEACNGRDDDCDGTIDPPTSTGARVWYYDGDRDGLGGARTTTACVMPAMHVADGGDCDDANAALTVASTFYRDADGDGFGDASMSMRACAAPAGYVADARDCNDARPGVRPGAAEACNGLDDDCSGVIDQGATCPAGCTGAVWGGHAYFFCTTERTWSAASSTCGGRAGFRLVRIESNAENNFVRGRLTGTVWIGGSDAATEGRWVWPDGVRFWQGGRDGAPVGTEFSRWGGNEPNDDGTEDCAAMVDATWNDDECDSTHVFACERW